MTKEWTEMTPLEKREVRFKRWLEADNVPFVSPETKEKYQERITRLIKVINMEEPDRIPLNLAPGAFPAIYRGGTLKEHMYEFETMKTDFAKFHNEFDMDFAMAPLAYPGKLFELIDFKLMQWPGHGVPDNGSFFQYVEGEYMKANEYDELLNNPDDFYLRKLLPRFAGNLAPLQMMGKFSPTAFVPLGFVAPFGNPEFRTMLKNLTDAADIFYEWAEVTASTVTQIHAMGFPTWGSSLSLTAYDLIADFLRGTQGVMLDMYRCPDKLLEAIDKFTPMTIELGLSNEATDNCPIVFIPLHKGADTWMSNEQFKKFYWPCLKSLMMGLYNEGLVPFPLAEATYNNRLEIITDIPEKSVMWWFEDVDMKRAKETVGKITSFAGGIQTSLLSAGSTDDIKKMVKRLTEDCGKDGGYLMSVSASVEQAKTENLHALWDAVKEYGNY